MTQPKKLTDAQLDRRVAQLNQCILTEQRKLLARIAAKRQRIAALHAEIADLHGRLHELPTTMVLRRGLDVPAADVVSVDGHDDVAAPYLPHIEHLRYGYAGVENLCSCAACLTDTENAS